MLTQQWSEGSSLRNNQARLFLLLAVCSTWVQKAPVEFLLFCTSRNPADMLFWAFTFTFISQQNHLKQEPTLQQSSSVCSCCGVKVCRSSFWVCGKRLTFSAPETVAVSDWGCDSMWLMCEVPCVSMRSGIILYSVFLGWTCVFKMCISEWSLPRRQQVSITMGQWECNSQRLHVLMHDYSMTSAFVSCRAVTFGRF